MQSTFKVYITDTVWQGIMIKKPGDEGGVGDGVLPSDVDWARFKDLLREHPEVLKIKGLVESTRQGLLIISGRERVDAAAALFTSLLKLEPVSNWRGEYEVVSLEELLEDAEVLALPMLWEMPEAIAIIGHTMLPVRPRRLFLVLSSPGMHGIIVFSQPTLGMLVREGDTLYLGYRGVDMEGNRVLIMEKSRCDEDSLVVDFMSVKPKGSFLAIIQPR
jgi:hypothetical protein